MTTLAKKQMTVNPGKAKEYFNNKLAFTTGPVELSHWIEEKVLINIIDVREAKDYQKEHIPGAVNLPKERWDGVEGLSKDRNNVLYCYTQTCHLAAAAAFKFAGQDYPVIEMEGGFKAWRESGLPIET